jgi:hypothetical protein
MLVRDVVVRVVVVRVRCDEALVRLMSTRLGWAELSNTARLVQPAYAYAASQPITMLAHPNATDRLKRLER